MSALCHKPTFAMQQTVLYSITLLAPFAERVLRNIRPGSRGSLRLDVGGPDHLAPLLGFGGEELAKFGRLTGKRCIAQIAESRFHLGAHETRIDLPVEPFDDVRRRIPGGAQAKPRARLVARHEITEYRNVRQDLRARGRRHRQGAKPAGANILDPRLDRAK